MQLNLADLFESIVDVAGNHTAIVAGPRRLTYAELDARANQLAHWFSDQGLGRGDHIGVHLFNGAEFLEVVLAAFKLRAVPININYRYVAHELRYLFENAELRALVHQQAFTGMVSEAIDGLPLLRTRVYLPDDSGAATAASGSAAFEHAMSSGSPARDFPPRASDDLFIIYTGGTTGMPRGVMWRHEDLFHAALQSGNPSGDPYDRPEQVAQGIADEERWPMHIHAAAPLIHGAAQLASWIALLTGGTIGLVPGRSFDAHASCRLITDEAMNVINVVGDAMARPFAEALAEGGTDYDMTTLVSVASAGAVLSDVVRQALEAVLPDTMILNNFGSSETGHQGTAFYDEEDPDAKPQWYMDESTMVLDDDLNPVAPGEMGRIARSGHLPLGYYKDPEKTAATFVEKDGKRWCLPGDMATVSEDGIVTLYGRGTMCINSGGEKVFPEEVEEALKSHPDIYDAVVVGVPDDHWGERVVALIQPRDGRNPTSESMDAHVRTRVAGYKSPRGFHLLDEVPRHPSGKPDYSHARAMAVDLES